MKWFGRRNGGPNGSNGNGSYEGPGSGTMILAGAAGRTDAPLDAQARAGAPETIQASLLLTYDGWLIGSLVHAETRVLDALNQDRLTLVTSEGAREIDRDDILMVVPPPLTAPSPMRIAKQLIPVSVNVGVGTLHGRVHVLPGVSPWEAWQRSSSGFVAVTGAAIDFPDGTTETAEVVLVSRHAAHAGLVAD